MEASSVTVYADKVGVNDFPIDRIMPVVSPVSKVVATGTKYEAKLLMAATSSAQKPEMYVGETMIPVDGDGVGSISFLAIGGTYTDEGFVKKTWTGKVKMKKGDGRDTVYTITEEYIVARPAIKVEAQAVNALYRNCGNKLNVQVPALGAAYNPVITAEGAKVLTTPQKGHVTVVPTGATVNLKVSSNGMYIGDQKYRVKLIPLPSIEVKVNGKGIDEWINGVEASGLRNLSLIVIPDKEFRDFLPDDAQYAITKGEITVARNRTGGNPRQFYSSNIPVGELNCKAGERLIIEVKELKRKNFQREWELVNMPRSKMIFTVTLI